MFRSLSHPLIPAKAGTQCFCEAQVRRITIEAGAAAFERPQNWVPAFAGMSGFLGQGLAA